MRNRVVLIKDYQVALSFAERLKQAQIPFATVEAEYGDFCVEGTHATLAHHVPAYREAPAPCIRTDVAPLKDGVILISHLDLDTLGGIALLEDCYLPHSFWESEAIIDTQGALGAPLIPEDDNDLMKIYWAWENTTANLKITAFEDYLEVTEQVSERLSFLNQLLSNELSGSTLAHYLAIFHQYLNKYLESCLYEDSHLRIFVHEDPMHFQVHRRGDEWVDVCLHYNPKQKTLILSDISGRMDCGALMKELFGEKAGGQYRIGGTPRDEAVSLFAVFYLKNVLQSRFFNNPPDCHLFFT